MMKRMRLYNRYLLQQLAVPALIATIACSGAVWLSQSLRFVDLIVNKGLPLSTFLYLTLLFFPSLLQVILPFSLFVAVLYVYTRLAGESELTALKAAGLSNLQLARAGIMIGIAVTILNYVITLYLMPAAFRTFKDLQDRIRNDFSFMLLQEGVFNSPMPGITVYIAKRDDNGELEGIIVHDNRDPTKPITMMAERGVLVNAGDVPRFVMEHGNRQELDPEQGLTVLYFDTYTVDLNIATPDSPSRWRKPKERYVNELLFPADTPEDRQNYVDLVSAGHERLAWPMAPLVFAVIAMAAIVPRDLNRRGHSASITVAVGAAIAVEAAALTASAFASHNLALVPTLYLAQLVPLAIGLFLLRGRVGRVRERRGSDTVFDPSAAAMPSE